MVRLSLAVIASLTLGVLANPLPQLKPDVNGEKNVGNGRGGQFITGRCLSNADCASGCCAVLGSQGICSGPAVSFAQGKQGCGFGGGAAAVEATATVAAPVATAAPAQPANALTPDINGEKNVGNGRGGQFITGRCLSNADCASGCCAVLGSQGICSGPAVSFAQGKQGCGFGGAAAAAPVATATPAKPANAIVPDAAGSQNVGNGRGQQFITGKCLSNADCASTCCATKNGAGVCSAVLVANDDGKQGCGFNGL